MVGARDIPITVERNDTGKIVIKIPSTDAVTEYKDIEVTFAPEALQAIVDWLSALDL